jgi:hypothetical protein
VTHPLFTKYQGIGEQTEVNAPDPVGIGQYTKKALIDIPQDILQFSQHEYRKGEHR